MFKKNVYHYLITVEGSGVNGRERRAMLSNTVEWSGTRHEAMQHFLKEACEIGGIIPGEAFIVCWSFEPNIL